MLQPDGLAFWNCFCNTKDAQHEDRCMDVMGCSSRPAHHPVSNSHLASHNPVMQSHMFELNKGTQKLNFRTTLCKLHNVAQSLDDLGTLKAATRCGSVTHSVHMMVGLAESTDARHHTSCTQPLQLA